MTERIRVILDGEEYQLKRALREGRHDMDAFARDRQRVAGRVSAANAQESRSFAAHRRQVSSSADAVGVFNNRMLTARNVVRLLKWPSLISGAGAAAGALNAAAAGAVALTGALGPLSGALVAIPAGVGAAGQALGTLKLATSGVGDAVKAMAAEQVKSGATAVAAAKDHEQSAERVRNASQQLAAAKRDVTDAERGVTQARREARRELEDLRLAARDAVLAERGAALSLADARRELAVAEISPTSTGEDRARARLAVDEALADQERLRVEGRRTAQELRERQRQNVEQTERVSGAQRQLADAHRQVSDAAHDLRRASDDAAEGTAGAGSAATKTAQELAKLPPEARKFAREIFALKPRLDDIREVAAEGLFPGLTDGLDAALGNLGVLRGAVGETADVLGDLGREAGELVGSKAFGKDFAKVSDQNARTIMHTGRAGLYLASATRHILIAGEPLIEWMGESIEHGSKLIDVWAREGRESGRLTDFFDGTRHSMELLSSITGHLAGGLMEVGRAAAPLGEDILQALDRSAGRWEEWTKSMEGRNELRAYFDTAKPTLFEAGRLTNDILKTFLRLNNQPIVRDLLHELRTELLPVLEDVTVSTTAAFGPHLIDALVSVTRLMGDLAGASGPLTVFVDVLRLAADAMHEMFEASPALKSATVTVLGAVAVIRAMKFAAAVTGVHTLATAYRGLAGQATAAAAATKLAGAPPAPGWGRFETDRAGRVTGITTPGAAGRGGAGAAMGRYAGPVGAAAYGAYAAERALGSDSLGGTGRTAGRILLHGFGPGMAVGMADFLRKQPLVKAGLREIGDAGKAAAGPMSDLGREFGILNKKVEPLSATFVRTAGDIARLDPQGFGGNVGASLAEALRVNPSIIKRNFKPIIDALRALPPEARRQGAETLVAVAAGMESRKELPKGTTARMRRAVVNEFDGMRVSSVRKAAGMVSGINSNLTSLQTVVHGAMEFIGAAANDTLGAFGAKKIDLALKKPKRTGELAGNLAGLAGAVLGANAAGGLYQVGTAGEAGGDRVPVSMNVGRGEKIAVFNRHQQQVMDTGAAMMGYRGMGDMFARVKTPHWAGRYAQGGIVPIDWQGGFGHTPFPGHEGVNAAVYDQVKAASKAYRAFITDAYGPGHQSPEHTKYGTAVDFIPGPGGSWGLIDKLAAWGVRTGKTPAYYDGRFGTTALPGHGPGGHLHLTFHAGGALAQAAGAAASAFGDSAAMVWENIGRVKIDGQGPMAKLAQAAADTVRDRVNERGPELIGGAGAAAMGGGGSAQEMGRRMMLAAGFAAGQWPALRELWTRESGWNPLAHNPSSGAHGIPQALPASKMASAGADYMTNPATQIKWGLGYIRGRYGSPASALSFHNAHNWYAAGGIHVIGGASTYGNDPVTGYRDPSDNNIPAFGGSNNQPGIAIYRRDTGGGYWGVIEPEQFGGERAVLRQSDLGPAPSTGAKIDINAVAARSVFHLPQGNRFPTKQGNWNAYYLGKNAEQARAKFAGAKGGTKKPYRFRPPEALSERLAALLGGAKFAASEEGLDLIESQYITPRMSAADLLETRFGQLDQVRGLPNMAPVVDSAAIAMLGEAAPAAGTPWLDALLANRDSKIGTLESVLPYLNFAELVATGGVKEREDRIRDIDKFVGRNRSRIARLKVLQRDLGSNSKARRDRARWELTFGQHPKDVREGRGELREMLGREKGRRRPNKRLITTLSGAVRQADDHIEKIADIGKGATREPLTVKDAKTKAAQALAYWQGANTNLGEHRDTVLSGIPVMRDRASGYHATRDDITTSQLVDLRIQKEALRRDGADKTPGTDNAAERAGLLEELLKRSQLDNRLLAGQGDVFSGFAPMLAGRLVGRFMQGTDRVLQGGLAVVHRDEQIVTDPRGGYGSQIAPPGGHVPEIVLKVVLDDRGVQRVVDARVDGMAARISEVQGGRARRIAAAPGR